MSHEEKDTGIPEDDPFPKMIIVCIVIAMILLFGIVMMLFLEIGNPGPPTAPQVAPPVQLPVQSAGVSEPPPSPSP